MAEEYQSTHSHSHSLHNEDPVNESSSAYVITPGLEILSRLEKMTVKQELELMEIICGCEGRNHYSIKDDHGKEIFKADETTGCCYLRCLFSSCKRARPFSFKIDQFDGHYIFLDRKIACNTCFCPCCLNKVIVTNDSGETLGYVKQKWSCCNTYFSIKDANGDKVLQISGPCCTLKCCCDVVFTIESVEGTEVGKISKKWGGILKEALTDSDNFELTFPFDLDVRIKATLLGAAILIDFMFFEDNQASSV